MTNEPHWKWREVSDPQVIEAMKRVDRSLFVPLEHQAEACEDRALPLGEGQTISQPFMVAIMSQALALPKHSRVLEIGTGSGYQAAILAEMGAEVYTIEVIPALAEKASALLASLRYSGVHVSVHDGYEGWPEEAPFDGIIVTCGAPRIPETLVAQLVEGRRLVVPVDQPYGHQQLLVLTHHAGGDSIESVLACAFVPMVGQIRNRPGSDRPR